LQILKRAINVIASMHFQIQHSMRMLAGVVAASLRHRDVNYPLGHRAVQICLKNMFNMKNIMFGEGQ
jgi:hypothetical protein